MCIIKLDYNQLKFKELFYYDETSSSCLRYKIPNNGKGSNKRLGGDVAGSIRNNKVWFVKIQNKSYALHRIIWYLFYGEVSNKLVIDHIDGNSLNNKIDNLRLTTQHLNNQNHSLQKNNKSGKTGVHFDGKKWRAQWCVKGKQKSKIFDSFEDAYEFREKVITEIGTYSERHGI